MKFGVITFPGSNCDQDCFDVVCDVLKHDVAFIWHQERDLAGYDCIIVPGGFSYGDYLRTGAVARFSPVMESLISFADTGGLVLGICNGFQILLEAGLLPGAMLRNRDLHFICKYVYVRTETNQTSFTHRFAAQQVVRIPIAHNEGNYFIDAEGLSALEENNQIVFRYADSTGAVNEEANPNGSCGNIAGIINKQGNVLGMMPHPERSAEAALGSTDGFLIFESLVHRLGKQ